MGNIDQPNQSDCAAAREREFRQTEKQDRERQRERDRETLPSCAVVSPRSSDQMIRSHQSLVFVSLINQADTVS